MTNLKCHFDGDGWLRGPINITHVMTPNRYDSGFTDNARGMVQHTESGFENGTVATFLDPNAQVSAFFSVGEDGAAHQYLPLGHGYVAWAEEAGNPYFRSCECEDKLKSGTLMTPPQITAFAQILEACSAYDGFPLQITDDPVHGRGLITHGDGGAAWGSHFDCPGDTRKAQRPAIIKLAEQIRAGGTTPPAARKWQAEGFLTMAALCAADLHEPVSEVLTKTAQNSPGQSFAANVAAHVNAVLATDTALCPAGSTWWYPHDHTTQPWVSKGQLSLGALASELGSTPAAMIALTVQKAGQFQPLNAGYLAQVFGRTALHLPAGCVVYY
jgi:hypothetical protein